MIDSHYCPKQDLLIETEQAALSPRLVITLGLQGQSCFKSREGTRLVFSQNHTTITSFQASRGERYYAAQQFTQQLRLVLSTDWLVQQIGDTETDSLFASPHLQLHHYHRSALETRVLSQQLRQKLLNGRLQTMMQQGLAQSIVALELERFWQTRGVMRSRYRAQDRQLAEALRARLDAEFCHAPTLDELAHEFELSAFRLQKLFQHFFQVSISDYVTQLKMHHAYHLLQQSGSRIADVAQQVGYRHQGNFSQAFRRYFGVLPNQLTRN